MQRSSSHTTALIFIFITILVDVVGIGLIIPVIPDLIQEITGEGLSAAGFYIGLLTFAFAIMQFFFSPVLGELSDRYGRRPVLLISLLGLGLDYIFHVYATSLAMLIAGRLLAGVTGASYTVATAYIADISTPENKAKNFGLVGAAFGLGFIIGPLIGGVAGEYWGVRAPFWIAAGLSLLNFVFGLFIIPESLTRENRRPVNLKKMIPFVSIFKLREYGLGPLLIAFFLASLAGQVLPVTWNVFTMQSYGWDQAEVGYSLAVVGFLVAIVQAVLLGKIVKKLGNKRAIMWGFILWTFGMTGFAFAYQPYLLFLAMVPYILGGIAVPTLQGYMSNKVPEKQQGNLQGSLTALISLCPVVGALLFANVYYYSTVDKEVFYFPGAPLLLGAVILVASTIVAWFALKSPGFTFNAVNDDVLDEPEVEAEELEGVPAEE